MSAESRSRRPRQVNLSGQEANPFAAWGGSSSSSGIQKTVAIAQAERQHRQYERERLSAAKRIQRTWRGHRSRKELADIRRQTWDDMEMNVVIQGPQISPNLVEELQLLLTFFSVRNPQDVSRLSRFGGKLLKASQEGYLVEKDLRPYLLRLARTILACLAGNSTTYDENLLQLLVMIIESDPQITPTIVSKHYEVLASLISSTHLVNDNKNLLLRAIRVPLEEHVDLENGFEVALSGYVAFTLFILPLENLSETLGELKELAEYINIKMLSEAVIHTSKSTSLFEVLPQSRLWLLAHFINIRRLKLGNNQDPTYMRALSSLLSNSASEIVNRIDVEDSQTLHQSGDDEDDQALTSALPRFIKEELVTLVDKQNITNLLAKFNSDYSSVSTSQAEDETSFLASYALMLLRIFPSLGEELRMWLYQGSVTDLGSGTRIPAVKLFWRVMSMTSTFSAIVNDSKSALGVLRPRPHSQSLRGVPQEEIIRERDWRAILLFLELYAFVLRFTDDEEFLNGGAPSISDPEQSISRSRESALPLQDVKSLTIFLKNLSFTMYFNASEVVGDGEVPSEGGLGMYFGTNPGRKTFDVAPQSPAIRDTSKYSQNGGFLGIPGMTFKYVRSIVTRVMRMLYERDSRRRFLPKDHWLMTSRFDMEGFIPAVVIEEERRHQVTEEGEEADEENDPVIPLVLGRREMVGTGRSRRVQQLESLQKQRKMAQRKKMLSHVTPRLEILQNMPYAIPFATRVQIFRQFVYRDQVRRRDGNVDPDHWRMSIMHGENPGLSRSMGDILNKHHAKIRRDEVFEDAYDQFYGLGEGLKEPIQITFVDKFDTVEAGIDGGGVTKEFLTSVTNEAFHSLTGSDLFVTNDQNVLYPNPAVMDEKRELLRASGFEESSLQWRNTIIEILRRYEFLGRIVGKCLYEGILVDISFAGFFLLKWTSTNGGSASSQDSGYLANINDLRDLDESLYQGLLQLKNYSGDVNDFSLDFTINDTVSMPGEPTRTITRNLLPNGSSIPVTNENRVLYVSLAARHRLHSQPFQQTRAFLRGLWDIINPSWLSMFNQAELQTLIGGDSSEIDVDDLRRNTIYSGVYEIGDDGLEHPTIQIFWEVLKNLDDSERRKVLKYVTSTPRAPLLGFTQLNPRFSIRDAGSDQQRLPSTSTCINLLKLPRYESAKNLREKLLYAVNSGAGFDLS